MNKANKQFREKYKCPLDGMVNLKMKMFKNQQEILKVLKQH